MDAGGWETVGPKLTRVADALDWWHVVEGPIATTQFDADDRAFLAEAHRIAGTIDWAGDPWHALTGGLKAATGRKGKPLFLPLRRALTGRDSVLTVAGLAAFPLLITTADNCMQIGRAHV